MLGFLRYNYHPAQIYMGDAGSLFIGLMLGALSITGQWTFNHRIAFVSPLMLLGIPIYDTAYVMILRTLHGRSMFFGSRDHLALRLQKLGLTEMQIVNIFYVAGVMLANMAFLVIYANEVISTALFTTVILVMIIAGVVLSRVKMEE